MEVLRTEPGTVLWELNEAPRYVVADVWDGKAVLVRRNQPDDTLQGMLEEACRLRKTRMLDCRRKKR